MAMRGRGRGRGGFGRGRGNMPGLKDDDGNYVAVDKDAGPPPRYPEMELPDVPEQTAKVKLLLLRRTDLLRYYKGSPYYIEQQEDKKRGREDEVEKYSDRFKKKVKRQKLPLASFLTLDPYYFPEELYSDKAKKISARAQKAGDLFSRSTEPEDTGAILARLDQLAAIEKAAAGGEGEGGAGGGKGGEGEQGAEVEDLAGYHDEDDEEVMEDDDYYQGEHFDDDEGYDDPYDDGGDEGAVY